MTCTRTVMAAICCLSVLALAACSDDDPEPHVTPTPSTSPSPSPSTSSAPSDPAEPTMPAEARGRDAAAAEAFVKYYWEMVNYAQSTGDLSGLVPLGSDDCSACKKGVAGLRAVFTGDGKIVGGAGRVSDLNTGFIPDDSVQHAVVNFKLSTSRQRVNYPGREKDEVHPAGTIKLRAILSPSGDAWVMTYWGRQ